MARDWNADWDLIEAEYQSAQTDHVELMNSVTQAGGDWQTKAIVEALRTTLNRLHRATKVREDFIDDRRKADPTWRLPVPV